MNNLTKLSRPTTNNVRNTPSLFNKLFTVLIIVFACLLSKAVTAQKTKNSAAASKRIFRAAVVKVDITPSDSQYMTGYQERKSTGIHDRIYHRIIALDDGITQFFLVSSEVCLFSPTQYDGFASQLESKYGIKPEHFWWTVTHTHSAPEVGPPGLGAVFLGERFKHVRDTAYNSLFEKKLMEGIAEARRKLAPARLGVGSGFSQASINRRAIDVDGKASLGLNPDGVVDRRIGLLRLEKEDGKLMALIANYPIHGTVLSGESLVISGDAPGVVSEYVEEKTGAPVLFVNGAAGNLAPVYSVYSNPRSGHLSQFRVLLGDKIIQANQKILSTTNEVTLNAASMIVQTPRKADLGWPSDMSKYSFTTKTGVNMVQLPIRFLKINDDVAIWSAPLELFCEISNEIRDRSPFPYTFYFGYSNGWLGYMPSEAEWPHGGYETTVSPYTPAAGKDVTEAVVGYLQGEMKSKK